MRLEALSPTAKYGVSKSDHVRQDVIVQSCPGCHEVADPTAAGRRLLKAKLDTLYDFARAGLRKLEAQ